MSTVRRCKIVLAALCMYAAICSLDLTIGTPWTARAADAEIEALREQLRALEAQAKAEQTAERKAREQAAARDAAEAKVAAAKAYEEAAELQKRQAAGTKAIEILNAMIPVEIPQSVWNALAESLACVPIGTPKSFTYEFSGTSYGDHSTGSELESFLSVRGVAAGVDVSETPEQKNGYSNTTFHACNGLVSLYSTYRISGKQHETRTTKLITEGSIFPLKKGGKMLLIEETEFSGASVVGEERTWLGKTITTIRTVRKLSTAEVGNLVPGDVWLVHRRVEFKNEDSSRDRVQDYYGAYSEHLVNYFPGVQACLDGAVKLDIGKRISCPGDKEGMVYTKSNFALSP
ncbi:MAG: hypothetical protein AB7Q01_08285 [Gammaproteobacteria bacterium]